MIRKLIANASDGCRTESATLAQLTARDLPTYANDLAVEAELPTSNAATKAAKAAKARWPAMAMAFPQGI